MTRAGGWRLAAALAAFLAPALAPAAGLAALNYDLTLGGNVNHTDNLHLEPDSPGEEQREQVQEMIYAVTPGIELEWSEMRDSLVASYLGQYLTFTGDEDRDAEWIHGFSGSLGWRRWEPYFLESGATYQRVPTTYRDQNESLVDQLDEALLLVRTGFTWPVGASGSVDLAYRGEFESFSGGGEGEDDRINRNYVEALLRRRLGSLWDGEVSARYGLVTQRLQSDSSELIVAVSLNHRLSERLSAGGGLQWVLQDYEDPESGGEGVGRATGTHSDFLASAELRRQLERQGFWSLRYDTRLEPQPDGDTLTVSRTAAAGSLRARLGSQVGATVWYEDRNYRVSENDTTAWGPTVTARWMIAPRVAFDLGVGWTETTTQEPGAADLVERTTRVGAGVVVQLGRQFVAEAGYVYRENDSDDDEDSYTANLFSAGVTYHFRDILPDRLPGSTIVGLAFSDEMAPAGR